MSNKSKVVHNTAALLTSVSWQWRPKKHSTSTSAKCSLSVYSRQTDIHLTTPVAYPSEEDVAIHPDVKDFSQVNDPLLCNS